MSNDMIPFNKEPVTIRLHGYVDSKINLVGGCGGIGGGGHGGSGVSITNYFDCFAPAAGNTDGQLWQMGGGGSGLMGAENDRD